MKEIVDALIALGVTGPAALGFIAAGFMIWTYVRNYAREIETKVNMATSFNSLSEKIATLTTTVQYLKEQLDRVEGRLK
jgi:hypothetical protein